MVTTERMNIYPISIEKLKEIAQQEKSNIASIRVLEKSNFVPNGKVGQEGIRFVWKG